MGLRISSIWIYREEAGKALLAGKDHEKGHVCLFGEWVGTGRGLWKKQSAWEAAEDRSGAKPDRMRGGMQLYRKKEVR